MDWAAGAALRTGGSLGELRCRDETLHPGRKANSSHHRPQTLHGHTPTPTNSLTSCLEHGAGRTKVQDVLQYLLLPLHRVQSHHWASHTQPARLWRRAGGKPAQEMGHAERFLSGYLFV